MNTDKATTDELGALDTIYRRRSVRAYAPEMPDDASIHRLLDAAVQAPTALHEEAWRFVVVQDRALLKRLSDRAKAVRLELEAQRATPSAAHPSDRFRDPEFNIFYDAGTLIVIAARPASEFATADCWLAAENLMLAATALGLGSCCVGFALPALRLPDVKAELGLPNAINAVAAIIVGVPRGTTPPVQRRPPEVLRWVRPAGDRSPQAAVHTAPER